MRMFVAKDTGYPLEYHLEDTYNVAKCYLENRPSQYYKYMLFCSYLHDIGKATPMFEIQLSTGKVPYGMYHTEAGYYVLKDLGVAQSICEIIGFHHGWVFQDYSRENLFKQIFKDNKYDYSEYKIYWENLLNKALQLSGLFWEDIITPDLNLIQQIEITGVVNFCDWLASNTSYFECTFDAESHLNASQKALSQLNSLFCVQKPSDFEFKKLNETQAVAVELSEKVGQGLYIIESPTGSGKTEAAIMLAKNVGTNGIVYCLPTQATTVAQADRLREVMPTLSYRFGKDHSNEVYYDKRADLAPFNSFYVCTIDQILLLCRDIKYFDLFYAAIENKVIILDEVHSYDHVMMQYVYKLLSIARYLHCTVILLSATLSQNSKDKFYKSYGVSIKERKKITREYPQVSSVGYAGKELMTANIPWEEQKEFKLNFVNYISEYNNLNLCNVIRNRLTKISNESCTGIILNTVHSAQSVYLFLKNCDEFKDRKILICHSQYLPEDRRLHELEILECCGKNSTYADRKGAIIIGTQVLEQALDIDFDYEITEICPIDLFYQRLGRLGRHERSYRAAKNFQIDLLIPQEGAFSIYDSVLVERTINCLRGRDIISTPRDVSADVNYVYERYVPNTPEIQGYLKDIKIFNDKILQNKSVVSEYLTKGLVLRDVKEENNFPVRYITEAKYEILLIPKEIYCEKPTEKDLVKYMNLYIRISASLYRSLKENNLLKHIDVNKYKGYDIVVYDKDTELLFEYSSALGIKNFI